MMKMRTTILSLMALASLTIASYAAGDLRLATDGTNVYRIENGNAVRMTRPEIVAYLKNWPKNKPVVVETLRVRKPESSWTYLAPGYDMFGYRDHSGVLHSFQADEARYNQSTRVYQVQINGHWLTVGEDVFQLN